MEHRFRQTARLLRNSGPERRAKFSKPYCLSALLNSARSINKFRYPAKATGRPTARREAEEKRGEVEEKYCRRRVRIGEAIGRTHIFCGAMGKARCDSMDQRD